MDPRDGSCWVADTGNVQMVHLVDNGAPGPNFADVPPGFSGERRVYAVWAPGSFQDIPAKAINPPA